MDRDLTLQIPVLPARPSGLSQSKPRSLEGVLGISAPLLAHTQTDLRETGQRPEPKLFILMERYPQPPLPARFAQLVGLRPGQGAKSQYLCNPDQCWGMPGLTLLMQLAQPQLLCLCVGREQQAGPGVMWAEGQLAAEGLDRH